MFKRFEFFTRDIMTPSPNIEHEVGILLNKHHLTLAIAESCSGGFISNMLTNVPGSSQYFIGGVIAYDNRIKTEFLNVPPETLRECGAVSEETALEMAKGIMDACLTDIGLSSTGIAGPEGGTREKPIGTVFIAISDKSSSVCRRFLFNGTRTEIKAKTSENALLMLKNYLMEKHRR